MSLFVRSATAVHYPTRALMRGPAWLVLPTYNEAENLERIVAAARGGPRGRRAARASASSSSTTAPRTARATSPTGSPRASRRGRGAPPHRREGLGPRLPRRLSPRARRRRRRASWRWTATSPTTPPTSRACWRRCATGADLALGSRYAPGGGVADWGLLRRLISRGGCLYAQAVLGRAGARPDRRLQVLPRARCSRRSTCRRSARAGYAFQVELTYRALRARLPRRRGADHLPRPRAGPVEDVLADRRRGDLARPGAAPARPLLTRPDRARRSCSGGAPPKRMGDGRRPSRPAPGAPRHALDLRALGSPPARDPRAVVPRRARDRARAADLRLGHRVRPCGRTSRRR